MAVYKGQFKNSMFNGLGRLEETYDNSQGESITRITILAIGQMIKFLV